MKLQKTDKARLELQPGVRTLGQRERALLLLSDGQKTIRDVKPFFDAQLEQMVTHLVSEGYLERIEPERPAGSGIRPIASKPTANNTAGSVEPIPEPVTPKVSADQFDGKRSLATTRMFLFDMSERMFARRDPVMADEFREALRHAKDRESMLEVSRNMITEIERVAGHERADSISERIAMLLPVAA
ncbi:MAG: hypothetical protein FD135_2743 [Comamonadaceae bacterium]|nr:MAG: hypothetical protein FD135_2743 [Comamonadaceae bacterium]